MQFIVLNKPYRVLSQFTDNAGRSTLADYVRMPQVYSIGRLDFDSEGLLLLSDDGALTQRIADPSGRIAKHYWVQVERTVEHTLLEKLCRGVQSRGECLRAQSVSRIDPPRVWSRNPPIRERKSVSECWLEIVLTTGRNRQIRRMTAAIGHPTLRLIRHRIGPWKLNGLQPGEYRRLDAGDAWQMLAGQSPPRSPDR